VALPEGSMVVNSSQGGGSKDTWVLTPSGDAFDRFVAGGARQPGAVWTRPLDQGPAQPVAGAAGLAAQEAQQQQAQQQAGPDAC
jgi:hypothetical protein